VIVTTVDSTHDEFIVRGLRAGLDVITEKPMTTDETKCQGILNAAEESKGELIVALNYRNGIIFSRLKEHLLNEKIGQLTSIDFHWYLNTYHGASYFRRWHGLRDKGGTLLCHKSAHHFDGGSTPNRSRYMPTVASSTTATTTLLGASAAWTARTRTSASSSGT
jgi:predicted dehydrogenase